MRRSRRLTLSGAVASVFACGHAPPPAQLELKHIGTPGGVWFDEACTPTGPETCGNAIDDNCNGVIDEGCGLAVGKLQFEIAWAESSATVELTVSDPQGDRIDGSSNHRETPSGLRLDKRCPQDGCNGQNVENIIFTGDIREAPLPGQYTVDVRLVDAGKASLPVKVHFGWRVGNRVAGTDVLLGAVDEKKEFSFEL
jgi:tRNA (guanosine-2'-O-)-methyltransferase